ncbi:8342_t:CDS:1 [Cetraspora pellucida]|uniref:8342_t:CDS:1 n=1 Tax=Cetraspora pellucida TaxID=1433469 RepID=A0ACA9K3E3_9GLOM|nr:8342_t:CDS:1 [Cetraspora pellucida]
MNSRFVFLLIVLALAVTSSNAQQNVTDLFFLAEADNNVCRDNANRFEPTDGLQKAQGSCSDTVQGEIPDVDHMVSSLIIEPPNGCTLAANKNFTVKIATTGLITGFFDNPVNQYYKFPQVVDKKTGFIFGHSHVTIQLLKSSTETPDPRLFAFFKGLNDPADNNVFTQVIGSAANNGLPPGEYRICTMVSSFAHQPTLMPVAQRGAQDDCIRINVVEDSKKRRNALNKKRNA